jgi:cytochrome c oxidase accessory protein FixG
MDGRYRRFRNGLSLVLQFGLFGLPWLEWGGRQAVLLDIEHRRLHLFGLVLHPQDTYYLLLLSLLAALTLFLVSAIAGRMWCGFACPQTIFTQSFIMVERWFEGDRAARLRLDRAPWSTAKLARKLGKWSVWTAMGLWLGMTFSGYYLPIREVFAQVFSGQPEPTVALVVLGMTAWCLFDFGYFREQFCHYVCPYSRFQSVMLDADSLIVGYDQDRGEPRGKLKQSEKGDCIDCSMCAQVCPMGIDIRDGFQMECIACTACIDACDQVMDKIHKPRGLIRYTSQRQQEKQQPQWLRTRVLVFTGVLVLMVALFWGLILTRQPLDIDAVRVILPGGQLAGTTPDGRATNIFKVHLINRTAQEQQIRLELEGLEGAEIVGFSNPRRLLAGEVLEAQVLVVAPRQQSRGVRPFLFRARANDGSELTCQKEATYVIP